MSTHCFQMIEFNGVANDPLMSSKFRKKRQLKLPKKLAAVLEKYRNSFCKFAKLAKAFNRDIVDRKCQTIIFLALPKKIGCFYVRTCDIYY